MNWYSVGLAAASGGLAALIASLIFGRSITNKIGYMIVVVLLFVGFNTLSKKFVLPELNASKAKADIESSTVDIPALASIKKYEPETYSSLVESSIEATKKGYSRQQTVALVRSQISGLIQSRLPHASDAAIVAYMEVMIREMSELQAKGDDLCFKLLFPRVAGSIDIRKVLSPDTREKDLAALDEVIKTSNTKKPIPAEREIMSYLEPVFTTLFEKYGEDVSMIEDPTGSNVDKIKVCNMTKDLYSRILELPIEQSTDSIRWMFGQM